MNYEKLKRPTSLILATAVALIFGFLTVSSGGEVLFIDGEARLQAGNYVSFVVWFNFLAGFIYIITAIGLYFQRLWAYWLSIAIVVTTALTFVLLGVYIANDGLYETRTLIAMTLRTTIWTMITFLCHAKLKVNFH